MAVPPDLELTGARIGRRDLLRLAAGGVGALYLFGCSDGVPTSPLGPTTVGGACETIPQEGAGPFPANGTNGPDVLSQAGVVRSDIRSSFAGLSGFADGVPLTVTLDLRNGCEPAAGMAVYMWHCDREGRYSLYSTGATAQNYLSGIQESNLGGEVSFTIVFPGCYPGRWPHTHFEICPNLADATDMRNKVATSQPGTPGSRVQRGVRRAGIREQRRQPRARFARQRRRLQGRRGSSTRDHDRERVRGLQRATDCGGVAKGGQEKEIRE